jgi:hypothetical protein
VKIANYHPGTGHLISLTDADQSPLEPGVFLVPAAATAKLPPEFDPATQLAIFANGDWRIEPIPVPPAPESPPPKTQREIALEAIVALEAEQYRRITARAQRELYLGIFAALGMTQHPAFAQLKALDDAIKVERVKL